MVQRLDLKVRALVLVACANMYADNVSMYAPLLAQDLLVFMGRGVYTPKIIKNDLKRELYPHFFFRGLRPRTPKFV